MTVYLLDVNVLVSLLDERHPMHVAAHRWFGSAIGHGDEWATCAVTENGCLRVASNLRYAGISPVGFRELISALDVICREEGHQFWPMDVSIRELLSAEAVLAPKQITDVYLLGLAVAHEGKFATFDEGIVTGAIPGSEGALEVIPH
jgi:toxin-antitoxin system PIN domain toxin